MKLFTKIAISFAGAAGSALLAIISISPSAMAARQAMFVMAANNATLYVMSIAVIGFFGSLYLVCKD